MAYSPLPHQTSSVHSAFRFINFISILAYINRSFRMNMLPHLPDSAFAASSELNDQGSASKSRLHQAGTTAVLSESSWYAGVQEPNQWIEVNFGSSTLFNEFTIAPSFPLDRAEYVKILTLFCGLVDFSSLVMGRFYLNEARATVSKVEMWYCRTVRLIAHAWENVIALRWEFHHIAGKIV